MFGIKPREIVIVDYGMGNLFSIKQMCAHVGMNAEITSSAEKILESDAVILPGVGAFGDAMNMLEKLRLVSVLKDVALSQKPFIGICLGMQLLMSASHEFGYHKGLGIIKGEVVPFNNPIDKSGKQLKIPHVCWNRIYKIKSKSNDDNWNCSPLRNIPDGEYMYFNHSFYILPEDSETVLSVTHYGNMEFCSSLQNRNIFACQFHPERSGARGLSIYKDITNFISGKIRH